MDKNILPTASPAPHFVPRYDDAPFRLGLILLISFFVSLYGGAGLTDSLSDPDFYAELSATLLFTALITEWIGAATRKLDRAWDWEHKGIARLFLQFFFGLLLPAIFELFLATVWFNAIGTDIRDTTFINYAFPFILLLILGFNGYYFTHYLYLLWKRDAKGDMADTGPSARPVPVYFGGRVLELPAGEILYAYRQGKYNYVKTNGESGPSYTMPKSLDELEKTLDAFSFFRLNRQLIAQRACCRGYTSIGYGKLLVNLSPASPFGKTTVVSQKKASAFREWIHDTGQDR